MNKLGLGVVVCVIIVLNCGIFGFEDVVSLSGETEQISYNFVIDRNVTGSVPTGFIKAKSESDGITYKIKRKVNRPGTCNQIQFINTPSPNPSPFVGSSIFTLIPNEMYNDRFAWTNGEETLSYIRYSDSDLGNWIVGVSPGVDSGYVYFKTVEHSISPLQQETDSNHWHWLMNGKWAEVPAMRVICVDEYLPAPHYFDVEFFDPMTKEVKNSHLVLDINPFILAAQEDADNKDEAAFHLKNQHNSFVSAYLDKDSKKWVKVANVASVAAFGRPVQVAETASGKSSTCVLVKEEHGGVNGWRLTFRKIALQTSVLSSGAAPKKSGDPYKPQEDEYLVEINNKGVSNGFAVSELTSAQLKSYQSSEQNSLNSVFVGDYVWLWVLASDSASADHSTAVSELLVKCIAQSTVRGFTTSVFEYYESDRMHVLRQTVLARDTDHLTITHRVTPDKKVSPAGTVSVVFKGRVVALQSLVLIGSDVLGFLRSHLVNKDGRPNGMSSCYMYHAAVSMPQPLVYAAEILCVLMGAKPVTMIQYTTPSEHQWKFPLVRELSQAIVANKALLGDALDLQYRVFKYKDDESLIIFRPSREYIADGLLPFRQAQALHPLPYPDSSRLEEDHRLQIYNSAWNGYMLGYPDYFVESYCETFHNDLPGAEKIRLARVAKADFAREMKKTGRQAVAIKMGLDAPVSEKHFQMILDTVRGKRV